jgi:hypothetical protein
MVVKKTEGYARVGVENKLTSRCGYYDNTTKDSFTSSKRAASASYNLFLSKDGLVSELLTALGTASGTSAVPDLTPIKDELKQEATDMITKVKEVLLSAMKYVSGVQDSESYITSIININSVFADLDTSSSSTIKSGSASASGSGASPPPSVVVDFEIGGKKTTGMYISTDTFGTASAAGVSSVGSPAPAPVAVPSIIYFDDSTKHYEIKRDNDAAISNLTKSITVLTPTPNVGTYVIVGDKTDINTMRPGIVTSLDMTDTTPVTIVYISDMTSPATTTKLEYDNATDSETHSTNVLTSATAISKKIWLSVPKEMIPNSSVTELEKLLPPPSPSPVASTAGKFNLGNRVMVVDNGRSPKPKNVEDLLKTPTQVYTVVAYNASGSSYSIETTGSIKNTYTNIPEVNLRPPRPSSPRPSSPPPSSPPPPSPVAAPKFSPGEVVRIHGLTTSNPELNGHVGVVIKDDGSSTVKVSVNLNGTYSEYPIPFGNLTIVFNNSGGKLVVPIPPGGLKPQLGPGGIAMGTLKGSHLHNQKVLLKNQKKKIFEVELEVNGSKRFYDTNTTDLKPIYSPFEVINKDSSVDLLAGGSGRGRVRGTRKYQNQKRRGNGNMRRRITRKVKRSRRIGVVHRGGGGRGGKIYRKTRKHVRRGRGGRGHGGHRRTIKKYHRR